MTKPEPIYRYRAVKPFEEEQSMLFFGRQAETEQLAALIFSEKLTVLYGKSGYGKSSLLNAGILPRLKAENESEKAQKRYVPIPVRFQAAEGSGEGLMDKFRFHFGRATRSVGVTSSHADTTHADTKRALPDTLWGLFKTIDPPENTVFVLLFDQFEEFFSYPTAQQEAFKEQLSELLYTTYPAFVRENRKKLSDADYDFLSRDLDVRAVFAIRADRLSDLDRLSRPLSAILKNRMELGALSETQAEEAILRPAALPNDAGLFKTAPFHFSGEALRRIKAELVGKDSKRIESFVLQIVCFSIEKTAERGGLTEITPRQLPDFDEVFDTYYREQLAELPAAERAQAAHLLEYALLGLNAQTGEAHRRSVDSADLAAAPALLDALESTYLIRREINSFGRFSYEISHDTLLEPVLKARLAKDAAEAEQKRLAEEAEERERLRAEAEARERQLAEETRKRRRANLIAAAGILLALLAGGASVFAYLKQKQATEALRLAKISEEAALKAQSETADALKLAEDNAKKEQAAAAEAKRQTDIATAAAKEAQKQTDIAKSALKKADDNLILAKKEEERAKKLLEQVANEQKATEAQRQAALKNLAIAEEKTKEAETERKKAQDALLEVQAKSVLVVKSLLKDARRDVLSFDYAAALEKLTSAADIGQMPDSVALALMEIAFFHTEADSLFRARRIAAAAGTLLGKKINTNGYTQDQLRTVLRGLAPKRYAELEQRYYPDMVAIKGGTFDMDEHYRVQVSDFRLAESETSFFQYALFCAATHRPLKPHKPSWGFDGRHVAVQVSWYDACLYANWLTKQAGMPNDTVYLMTDRKISENDGFSDTYTVTIREGAKGYRLPTEAEWQWAAGGGDTANRTEWAGTSEADSLRFYMNTDGEQDGWQYTAPVKTYRPNRLGLYDMSGNAWEWCWDWYRSNYTKSPEKIMVQNPHGPAYGSYRVTRGGSWGNYPRNCRVADRNSDTPGYRNVNVGFRLARTY